MAPRAPIDVTSVTDRVYAHLRDRITSGALGDDARLRQEAISAELGVSRTPVREALGRLAADGLVELLPNRGARVADVSPADMRAAYAARLVIEPAAARIAAQGRPHASVRALRAAIAAQRRAGEDAAAAFNANRDFHLALVAAAANPFLSRFAELLWARRLGQRIYAEQLEGRARGSAFADEHEAIAAAVAAGDAPRAEELTRAHVAGAMELLLAQLEGGDARGSAP